MSVTPPRYAVIGNPIAHSKSPEIHAAFAAQCGIALTYERVLLPVAGFGAGVDALRAEGVRGANVTVPFKEDAYRYAAQATQAARWAGAANTLVLAGDVVCADNTDGRGLLRDIQHNCGVDVRGKRVLLLGAGGAARGVLAPLLAAAPASIELRNRSRERAETWLRELATHGDYSEVVGSVAVRIQDWHSDATATFDVVINATASGLTDEFDAPRGVAWAHGAFAYEMVYGKTTAFMAWANAAGARSVDGWGMLVEQAAASFQLWHGVRPDTQALIQNRGV